MFNLPKDSREATVQLQPAMSAKIVTEYEDLSTVQTLPIKATTTSFKVIPENGRVVVRYNESATATEYDDIISPDQPMLRIINVEEKTIDSVTFLAKDTGAKAIVIQY